MRSYTYYIIIMILMLLPDSLRMQAADRAQRWRQLQQAGQLYREGQPDSALTLADGLLPVAVAEQDHVLEAMIRMLRAIALSDRGEKRLALEEYVRMDALSEAHHFIGKASKPAYRFLYQTVIPAYAQLAVLCDEMGRDDQCLVFARRGLEWVGRCDDRQATAMPASILTEMTMKHGGQVPVGQTATDSAREHRGDRSLDAGHGDRLLDPDLGHEPVPMTRDGLTHPRPDTTLRDERVVVRTEYVQQRHERIGIAAVLLAVLVIAFLGYALRQRRVSRRRQEESEKKAAERYREGQETERSRLAKELHDGISNQLLAVQMRLSEDGLTPQTLQLLDESREQVRRVSHDLIPPEFAHATLDEVVAAYVRELGRVKDCEVTFATTPQDADWTVVADNVALEVYRIVQETVGNALKHSEASLISVGLHLTDRHELRLVVCDNGTADITAQPPTDGIGSRTVRQRADAIGGELRTYRNPFGNVVELKAPVKI